MNGGQIEFVIKLMMLKKQGNELAKNMPLRVIHGSVKLRPLTCDNNIPISLKGWSEKIFKISFSKDCLEVIYYKISCIKYLAINYLY